MMRKIVSVIGMLLLLTQLQCATAQQQNQPEVAGNSSVRQDAVRASTANGTPDDTIRIMPFGNSLTQSNEPGYRGYLYQKLVAAGYKVDFVGSKHDEMPANGGDPDHSGFGGYIIGPGPSKGDDWDTWQHGDVLYHLDQGHKVLDNKADIILMMIGINDFFNSRQAGYDPKEVGADHLDSLISKIYTLDPNAILLVSNITPLRGDPDFAALFNSEVPGIVHKYQQQGRQVYFVNMRDDITWDTEQDLGEDRLHPTDKGYEKIAAQYFKVLTPILDKL